MTLGAHEIEDPAGARRALDRGFIDPEGEMPEEYIGDFLRFVTAHEVGHTLGLRHNFKSSGSTPFTELNNEHIDALAEYDPEIVLLGSGERLQWPDPSLTGQLLEKGIGVEVMDTGAACRTFNILIAERRNVVAGLFL